jgi:hypothetical protein
MFHFFRFGLLSLILTLVLVSCHDLNKQKQLKKIDVLMADLDYIDSNLKLKHADSIPLIVSNITHVELRIKNNYTTDTIDLELAKKMDEYKRARKQLKPMGKILSKIIEGSKEERITLSNLKTDIENGSGDRSKYDEYIEFERAKVIQLKELHKELTSTQERCFEAYYKYHDELDAFATSLIKK